MPEFLGFTQRWRLFFNEPKHCDVGTVQKNQDYSFDSAYDASPCQTDTNGSHRQPEQCVPENLATEWKWSDERPYNKSHLAIEAGQAVLEGYAAR